MLCPRCDYDLTGLPAEHTCPECGCRYDEHSLGIPLTGRRNERWVAWFGVLCIIVVVLFETRRGVWGWDAMRHFVVLTPMLLAIGIRLGRRAGLPTRMVLDREGVELITPGQEPLRWQWAQIESAQVESVWGAFQLISTDGPSLISRNYARLGRWRAAKRCAAEINDRVALYASRTGTLRTSTES